MILHVKSLREGEGYEECKVVSEVEYFKSMPSYHCYPFLTFLQGKTTLAYQKRTEKVNALYMRCIRQREETKTHRRCRKIYSAYIRYNITRCSPETSLRLVIQSEGRWGNSSHSQLYSSWLGDYYTVVVESLLYHQLWYRRKYPALIPPKAACTKVAVLGTPVISDTVLSTTSQSCHLSIPGGVQPAMQRLNLNGLIHLNMGTLHGQTMLLGFTALWL